MTEGIAQLQLPDPADADPHPRLGHPCRGGIHRLVPGWLA